VITEVQNSIGKFIDCGPDYFDDRGEVFLLSFELCIDGTMYVEEVYGYRKIFRYNCLDLMANQS